MSQQEPIIQNGQRSYRAGSIGAQLFALSDERQPKTQKEAIAFAVAAGFNEKSAAKNFYEWRRFNGLAKPMDYLVFTTNDAEYLEWLKIHPQGYVLNSYRSPNPKYLILHRAWCPTIQKTIGDGYLKVCADSIEGLWQWLNEKGFDEFSKEEHYCNKESNGEQEITENTAMINTNPLNQILFGPPGTGKTYNTINKALEILDPAFLIANSENRSALKARFDNFVEAERIVFCTFHQSFSYEDFVEGLRATSVDGQIKYSVESGVFKEICERALKPVDENFIDEGLVNSASVDEALQKFIAQVTAEQMRLKTKSGKPFSVSYKSGSKGFRCVPDASPDGNFMQPGIEQVRQMLNGVDPTYNAIYARSITEYIKEQLLTGLRTSEKSATDVSKKTHVLIIDEINRGNISKIFGELITLIEPSKRAGRAEALTVTLPYSKESFSVPDNVYLIGTMNTADRSLASLDIALRRRFDFIEMPPLTEKLDGLLVSGVDVGALLRAMNQRIEVLLGREHCLGHAYFLGLTEDSDLEDLAVIFRWKIIPLLQEYFFEDWERISWVLNDHRKAPNNCFLIQPKSNLLELFGDVVGNGLQDKRWQINAEAFERVEAYAGVISIDTKIAALVKGREVIFAGLTVRQLESGTIEIWDGDTKQSPVKPKLRDMAIELSINLLNAQGNMVNTRQLGKLVIDAVKARA
jgi:5-methylcytosine-specific restriction protein B